MSIACNRLWATAAAALVFVAGCTNSDLGTVSGKVTFRGAPVGEGLVSFFSEAASYAADAQLSSDGTFRFNTVEGGLPPGEYIVCIIPPMTLDSSDPHTPPVPVPTNPAEIPKKYRLASTSGLFATVKAGKNEHNFDMQ